MTRGIPSDLASLSSVNMGMFSTSALYSDPLLDGMGGMQLGSAALRNGSTGASRAIPGAPMSGVKAGPVGAGRGNFDTASLKSQDDTAR